MKFSPCSWLRMVRGLSPHERVSVWAREAVATQRQVHDLTVRVGELEVAVAELRKPASATSRCGDCGHLHGDHVVGRGCVILDCWCAAGIGGPC